MTLSGAWQKPIAVKAALAGRDLDATVEGTTRALADRSNRRADCFIAQGQHCAARRRAPDRSARDRRGDLACRHRRQQGHLDADSMPRSAHRACAAGLASNSATTSPSTVNSAPTRSIFPRPSPSRLEPAGEAAPTRSARVFCGAGMAASRSRACAEPLHLERFVRSAALSRRMAARSRCSRRAARSRADRRRPTSPCDVIRMASP